jgi:Fe-S-cluster containining protein
VSSLIQIENADRDLLASIAASMVEATRRSGSWLACRLGCTQCCIGPFAITQLDVLRLRSGLAALEASDPARAVYPGDPCTGELFGEQDLPDSTDELPCPALDPATGACDLYDARPITCRSFGPATKIGEGRLAACELCYVGATDAEIAACAVELDPEGLELTLVEALEKAGRKGVTIVGYALV